MGRLKSHGFRRFWRDRRGSVSPMLVLLMIPLVGAASMAVEASSWFLVQRAMQNAADSAAVAAATNGCATGQSGCDPSYPSYIVEARAVAARFGFPNAGDTTVTPVNNVTCPSGTTDCYQVTITRKVPVYLTRIVGFRGDATTANGASAQLVRAVAIASSKSSPAAYCMTALGASGDAIRVNGGPYLGGDCSVYVPNGGARCNGGSGSAIKYADVKTSNNQACGTERLGAPAFTDNYQPLAAAHVPVPDATRCPGSPQYPKDGRNVTLPAANRLQGSPVDLNTPRCGDVKLTGDTVVTSDTVLIIYNGHLDLQTYKLSTANGAHLTIIFSGDASNGYDHFLTGSGTLDIVAPTSGTWSGVAIYQDPRVGGNRDFTYSGSSPTLKVTGLVYAKNANIEISGDINHAANGEACLSFMANTILINGTARIFQSPTIACDRAGLILPTASGSTARAALVR